MNAIIITVYKRDTKYLTVYHKRRLFCFIGYEYLSRYNTNAINYRLKTIYHHRYNWESIGLDTWASESSFRQSSVRWFLQGFRRCLSSNASFKAVQSWHPWQSTHVDTHFLQGRNQRVRVGRQCSEYLELVSGVVRESCIHWYWILSVSCLRQWRHTGLENNVLG